jgi:hypothetical protein
MRRTLIRSTVLVAIVAAGQGIGVGSARACALDNVPSLTADGQLDRITTDPPTTSAQLATWSPFILPRTYTAGHAITFAEIRKEVARSLVPDAMRRPWHWEFGDGGTAVGWTVRHAYARGGHWRIVVYAYSPVDQQWHDFDHVTITVASASHARRR